ncbi:hypothetical protein sos41_31130 [Alphaproteobacteria bacterium SO-S41]|nr:hypothetical protein sos41_31130 [Alphaproteobacteria bacterium SO-S41]
MDDETFNRTWRAMLSPYGVAPETFQARYDEDLRDYEIVISAGPLSVEQVEAVRHLLPRGSVVTFTDAANAETWRQLSARRARVIAKARAQTLRQAVPDLPVFDPTAGDLAAFVHRVEHYCGYAPGSAAEVRSTTIWLRPPDIGPAFARFADVLAAGTVDVEAVKIAMIGTTVSG